MMRALILGVLVAVIGAFAVGLGCGTDRQGSALAPPADDPPSTLSEPLLIALAQAKNFHHRADVHLADGDTEAAIQDVTNILTIEFPAGAPEAEDTLLDARARLGKLYLGAGRLDQAEKVVDEGIAEAARESFFLANLNTVQGEIRHARAATFTDPAAKKEQLHRAIESIDRSIEINKKLQKRLHEEATRP
jgi:hypothetical protein